MTSDDRPPPQAQISIGCIQTSVGAVQDLGRDEPHVDVTDVGLSGIQRVTWHGGSASTSSASSNGSLRAESIFDVGQGCVECPRPTPTAPRLRRTGPEVRGQVRRPRVIDAAGSDARQREHTSGDAQSATGSGEQDTEAASGRPYGTHGDETSGAA